MLHIGAPLENAFTETRNSGKNIKCGVPKSKWRSVRKNRGLAMTTLHFVEYIENTLFI
jgi:hypothetical protein